MLHLASLFLGLIATGGTIAAPPLPKECPVAASRAAAAIQQAVGTKGFHHIGRPKLDALVRTDIVPADEAPVCRALEAFYAGGTYDKPGWHRAYFKTGGYYMASIYYMGRNKRDVKTGHIAIFSGKLRLVSVVMARG